MSDPAKVYHEPMNSVPEMTAEHRALFDEITARRPAHICGAHWLQVCEGADRVTVESCACRDLTGTEARLLRQLSPSSPISSLHSGHDRDDVSGTEDDRAARMLALRERAMKPIQK